MFHQDCNCHLVKVPVRPPSLEGHEKPGRLQPSDLHAYLRLLTGTTTLTLRGRTARQGGGRANCPLLWGLERGRLCAWGGGSPICNGRCDLRSPRSVMQPLHGAFLGSGSFFTFQGLGGMRLSEVPSLPESTQLRQAAWALEPRCHGRLSCFLGRWQS